MYSKEFPNELEQSFCDKIYDEYGLFIALRNPALEYLYEGCFTFTTKAQCFTCSKETECKVCLPTRKVGVSKFICFECHYDWNMFAINSGVLDYARSTKSYSLNEQKLQTTEFFIK